MFAHRFDKNSSTPFIRAILQATALVINKRIPASSNLDLHSCPAHLQMVDLVLEDIYMYFCHASGLHGNDRTGSAS